MELQPLDVVVSIALALNGSGTWTQKQLSESIGVSQSEINRSIRRLEKARLLDRNRRVILRRNLLEFILHGVKYAFPAERGAPTIGLPTGYAASPLKNRIVADNGSIPVWPSSDGPANGYTLLPLHKSVVRAAKRDVRLYESLALVDAIRDGKAREVKLATAELTERLA